jgi:hypothetical protein
MHTPYFPTFRSRLAALGRRTTHLVRQATLAQLEAHLRDFLPAPLLSAEDQGPTATSPDEPVRFATPKYTL